MNDSCTQLERQRAKDLREIRKEADRLDGILELQKMDEVIRSFVAGCRESLLEELRAVAPKDRRLKVIVCKVCSDELWVKSIGYGDDGMANSLSFAPCPACNAEYQRQKTA